MTRRKIIAWISSAIVVAAPFIAYFGRGDVYDVSPFLPGEAARQVAAFQRAAGASAKAVSIDVTPKGLALEVQSKAQPKATDSWQVWHLHALRGLVDWIHVSGPTPNQTSRMDVPVDQRIFDLKEVDFKAVGDLAKASIDRVALEENATVEAMHISRSHVFLPYEQAGPLGWRIEIKSPHESAAAFADPAGKLTGVNLDGTLRAQALDLYQGGKPLLDIVHQIDEALGNQRRISKMLVYSKSIRFEVPSPDGRQVANWYDGNINGVRREAFDDPMVSLAAFGRVDSLFSIEDVDWGSLGRLMQAARGQLNMADAKIKLLEIRKRARGFTSPAIEWDFDLQPPNGPSASVVLDNSAKPLQISGPRGQEKPHDRMAPAKITQFLDALRQQLGPNAGVMKITLEADQEIAEVRSPSKPAMITQLNYDGYSFRTFGDEIAMPGKWQGLPYEDDWLFDLQLVDEKLLTRLPRLSQIALAKLNIPDGKVRGIAISEARDMFENNHQLLVEIDVASDNHLDGRIYFAPNDRILRMDAP